MKLFSYTISDHAVNKGTDFTDCCRLVVRVGLTSTAHQNLTVFCFTLFLTKQQGRNKTKEN